MNRYKSTLEKLQSWMGTNFHADGYCTIDAEDSRYYHKTPYLFAAFGMRGKGARVARYVMEHFVDKRGDIVEPPGFNLETRTYCMGWLAMGGMMVERFDLAEILANRLTELQDLRSGVILLPDEDLKEVIGDGLRLPGSGLILPGQKGAGKKRKNRRKK